jgi:hypothetical protein
MHRNEFNPGERSSDEDNQHRLDHRFYALGARSVKSRKPAASCPLCVAAAILERKRTRHRRLACSALGAQKTRCVRSGLRAQIKLSREEPLPGACQQRGLLYSAS